MEGEEGHQDVTTRDNRMVQGTVVAGGRGQAQRQ